MIWYKRCGGVLARFWLFLSPMVFIKVHVGFVNVQDGLQLIAAGTVRPALLLARSDMLERVFLTVPVSFRLPVLVTSVIFGMFETGFQTNQTPHPARFPNKCAVVDKRVTWWQA